IPYKGAVLTQLTAWWLRHFTSAVRHHMLSADATEIVALVPALAPYRSVIAGRAMLCHRTQVFPVECVVRGYLSGSAWKEYRARGTMHGVPLPKGMEESQQLPEPVFTPSTKADTGHDENISVDEAADIVGADVVKQAAEISFAVY